jgi:hypothetical protein
MARLLQAGLQLIVQTEAGHNLRWNSDKIMPRAAINDKRIYHLSMVNSHLSFGRCKSLACAVLIKITAPSIWSPKMTIDN